MAYKCNHFAIHELVSPGALDEIAERILWRRFDPNVLKDADKLRERYGACYINTHGFSNPNILGEVFSYSGFLMQNEYVEKRSQGSGHRYFKCLDMKFTDVTTEEIREDLFGFDPQANAYLPKIEDFPHITEVELGTSWLHVGWGTNTDDKVLVYRP